ncbi:MAG TPA: PQQ-binding-like beta-propeller repeat protein, partial [Vicinamibacteria bacterium]|nr:PQQ-binding-like beta-propeller repeat protein [Vicinamibacteria bacterium]
LFDGVTAPGLKVAWTASAGSGYSGVVVVGGRAFTAFAAGTDDVVAAFDAATGRELWRAPLGATHAGHDGSHSGPIATPAADERRVYDLGPRGKLLALDARTGASAWSQDLAGEKDVVVPFYGWATSPLLAGRCAVVQHAVKDKQAVACYDRDTGRARWTAGRSEVWYQSPVLATLGGREQVVAADQQKVYGLDVDTGAVLWEHAHEGDGSPIATGSMVPLAIDGDRVLITPKDDATVLLRITPKAEAPWTVERVWTSKAFRRTYSRPVYHRGLIFAYSGAFLACLDAATGESKWRSRAPGDGFLAVVDGRLVIQTKTGSLHVAEASGEGYKELAQVPVFPDDHSWTAPSVAGGRLFVRGMTQVAAVSVVDAARGAAAGPSALPLGPRLARFLDEAGRAPDKGAAVESFVASVESFPLIEGDVVEFLYRGPGKDLGIASDVIGARAQRPMSRLEGTDFFYWTARVRPGARLTYRFVRDLDENVPDPRNPRKEPGQGGDMSWFAMPGWQEPTFLAPAPAERKGRLETHTIDSAKLAGKRTLDVYLPAGYDANAERLPAVYVTGGKDAIEQGGLPNALDHLIGSQAPSMLVVFVHPQPPPAPGTQPPDDLGQKISESLAEEVVPFVDGRYRTRTERGARAIVGGGFAGYEALDAAFRRPDVFGRVSTQSAFMLTEGLAELKKLLEKAKAVPESVSLEWSTYDLRAEHEGWNNAESNRALAEYLKGRGVPVTTREVSEGFAWGSWRNRADLVFGRLFG